MRCHLTVAPALAGLLSILFAACRDAGPEGAPPDPSASASAAAGRPVEEAKELLSFKRLAPNERRVKVIVLPVEAQVEVDGVPTPRRDGVIDLVGTVGAIHELHVFWGAESRVRAVTVEETGPDPEQIDLERGQRHRGRHHAKTIMEDTGLAPRRTHGKRLD